MYTHLMCTHYVYVCVYMCVDTHHVHRSLLIVYRALLSVYRSLLMIHRALLSDITCMYVYTYVSTHIM